MLQSSYVSFASLGAADSRRRHRRRPHPRDTRLPTETEIAKRFGVSRGVARESLRSLEERGLVTVRHGIGATVRPSSDWDMFSVDVIEAVLEHQGGAKLLGDYLECRRLLEIEAAGLAARRATGDDLMALVRRTRPDDLDGGRGAREPVLRRALPRGRRRVPPGADPGDRQPGPRPDDRARAPCARRGAASARAPRAPPGAEPPRAPRDPRRRRRARPGACARRRCARTFSPWSATSPSTRREARPRPEQEAGVVKRDGGLLRQPRDAGARGPRLRPSTATQVAAELQVHPRTARRLLNRMVHDGWLTRRDGARPTYTPTMRIVALAAQLAHRAPLVRHATEVAHDLHERLGSPVHLAIPSYRSALRLVRVAASGRTAFRRCATSRPRTRSPRARCCSPSASRGATWCSTSRSPR